MSTLVSVSVPILAAVVTAVVGIVSYIYQKRTDRKVELRKQQREAYERYMESYQNWAYAEEGSDEEEKAGDAYRQAYFSLFRSPQTVSYEPQWPFMPTHGKDTPTSLRRRIRRTSMNYGQI